jgi:TatD DNase family protein
MPTYVDTHTHLDHHDELSPAEQVSRAHGAGVTTLVTVGTDLATSTHAVQAAKRFDGVHAVVGVHPNDAMEASPQVLAMIELLAAEPEVVGIGETGLDHYRDWCPHDVQETAFRAQIDIARSHDKALVIHCRDAWPDTLRVLDDHGAPDRVVLHCFSGDLDVVAHAAARGWFMSFAGNVTFKNAQPLRDAAAAAPLALLLTETDSPFLTPEPHRGTRNDSSRIPLVVAQLARELDLPDHEVAAAVLANAHRAFDLPVGDQDVEAA